MQDMGNTFLALFTIPFYAGLLLVTLIINDQLRIPDQALLFTPIRASGPGGQHVNKTESAIRLTHLPTGLVVSCQDEKSQHKNKAKPLMVMRARLLDKLEQERHDKIAEERKGQVGSGRRNCHCQKNGE